MEPSLSTIGRRPILSALWALGTATVAGSVSMACVTPVVASRDIQGVGIYTTRLRSTPDGILSEVSGIGICRSPDRWSLGFQRIRLLRVHQSQAGVEFHSEWLHAWTGERAERAAADPLALKTAVNTSP